MGHGNGTRRRRALSALELLSLIGFHELSRGQHGPLFSIESLLHARMERLARCLLCAMDAVRPVIPSVTFGVARSQLQGGSPFLVRASPRPQLNFSNQQIHATIKL